MRVSLANARLVAGALLVLGVGACGAAHDADLFRSGGTLGGSGGAGSASGAAAYPDAGGASSGGGALAGNPEGSAGSSDDSGGGGSSPPNGGASGGSGPIPGGANGGGAGGALPAGGGANLSDCARFGTDASYFEETKHCYLVVRELATFADAQAHCKTLGAHLVTLASEAENDFAWNLNSDEHWIGAEDGKGPQSSMEGTFTWVTGEPFTYTNWSSNQPNTSDTDCGESGLTGHCYEHCAFQWTGGEHDGQWNDRFCLHTIAAICEWDSGK